MSVCYSYDALTYMYDCAVQHASLIYKFTGKERDTESGIDDFGARYYPSALGRFASVDLIIHPSQSQEEEQGFIVDPQHWNKYVYANNNPLIYVDPDGTEAGLCYGCGPNGTTVTPLSRDYPKENHPIVNTLLIAGIGLAAAAPEIVGFGRTLLIAATNYFLTPQGQQTATNIAEAISPPGSNIGLGRTFGFASTVGPFEGFTVGRFANGAEVAASMTKSGSNVTASIAAAYNPDAAKAAGTLLSIFKGAQAVAKEQGASTLTIQAVAVSNKDLAKWLLQNGFVEKTVTVGKQTVTYFVKTIEVK